MTTTLTLLPSHQIYVAGPMRGYPDFNFPAFHAAARSLRALGHFVFSPAERDIEKYGEAVSKSAAGDESEAAANVGFSLREALEADMIWICRHASAIALLPGWEKSKGASAEAALGRALGLVVAPLESFIDTVMA